MPTVAAGGGGADAGAHGAECGAGVVDTAAGCKRVLLRRYTILAGSGDEVGDGREARWGSCFIVIHHLFFYNCARCDGLVGSPQSQTVPTASTPLASVQSPVPLATQSSSDSGFYSPGRNQSALLDNSMELQGADSAGFEGAGGVGGTGLATWDI